MAKKEMDKLSRDSTAAWEAGMSYGKYMAMKESAEVTQPASEGDKHTCQHCGKAFFVSGKRVRRFCSDRCRNLSYYVPKEAKPVEKTCPICGRQFMAQTYRNRYCGEYCARVGQGERVKEYQARKKAGKEVDSDELEI